jgi:MFS family permease
MRLNPVLSESEQAHGRRLITTINCVGCIPGQVFLGSVLLLFLTSLAMNRVGIMVCLSIPAFVAAVCQIPFAHWADRVGKKKTGHAGMVLVNLTFIVLLAATFVSLAAGRMLALVMVVAMTLGLVPSVTGRAQGPSCD